MIWCVSLSVCHKNDHFLHVSHHKWLISQESLLWPHVSHKKINIFSSCFNHKKRALSKAKTTRNNVREIQFVGLFVTFYLSELSTGGAKWDVEGKLPHVPTNHLNCIISRRSTLGQAGSGLVILMLMKMKVGLCGLCLVAHLPTVKARILHRIDIAKVRYCTGIVTLAKQL